MPIILDPGSGGGTGTPITAPSAAPNRRSWANIRRLLAQALGGYLEVVTTAREPTDTSTAAFWSTALTATIDANRFRNAWAMPLDGTEAGKVRRIGQNSLVTVTGRLVATVGWDAAIGSGVRIGLFTLLPPVDSDLHTGLLTCANRALADLVMPHRLALVTSSTTPEYDLSSYDWLDVEAVHQVYGPPASASDVAPAWYTAVRQDAQRIYAGVLPLFGANEAATVEVFRPLDTWLKRGGVWQASSGFTQDTDECMAQPERVVQFALAYAYEALARERNEEEGKWQALADRQRRIGGVVKAMLDQRMSRLHRGGVIFGGGQYDPKADPLGWWR